MAKISFNKLNLKKDDSVEKIKINDIEIEVKQYLPISEKLGLIENVLNTDLILLTFNNPLKAEVYKSIEIISAYTNITFTEKQKEEMDKTYDLLEANGIINKIISAIPEVEYKIISDGINDVLEGYFKYKNSAAGIMETISADYSNLNFDIEELQKKISNKENIQLVSDIVNKLD